MRCNHTRRHTGLMPLTLAAVAGALPPAAQAQETQRRAGSATLLEEVVVTARKREEGSQDVPLAITAFGADQIEALKIRDLTNLSVGMPNVALDDVGTTRGTANFSIRGLGINSSIPSIDPTVGVFVNGVYLGINNGVIFDVFDLERIEVLRGPQGILFGRNVTGGAILMNTKTPGDEFEATLRTAVDGGGDGGLNYYAMGAVGGPVTDTLGLRLSAYYNEDEGYFENRFDGNDFGALEQRMVRGTLRWTPTNASELLVRYENTDIEGDGPASQTHRNGDGIPGAFANFERDSFDFSIDDPGFQTIESDFVTIEYNQDVALGEGTVTALYGWRDFSNAARSDIDAQPVWLFHAPTWLEAEQNSLELRYNGQFGRANVTTGIYWFDNDVEYHERRDLLGIATGGLVAGAQFDGGGLYTVETLAAFTAVEYDIDDRLTLTIGARYTEEDKSADVASLSQNISSPPAFAGGCNIVQGPACPFDFQDADSWGTFAPKVGLSYALDDQSQVYGFWSRGFRSGGYNLRNTSFDPADVPGPFDEEQVDSFELGYKSTHAWGRLNGAVFYNTIKDMQRELNLPNQGAGVVQLVRNTADATIFGAELDGTFQLGSRLLLRASIGYLDASYDDVFEDLNQDGVIGGADEDLELPRAPELTWQLGANYDMDLGDWAVATARISYAYRDEVAYTDDNRGFILEQEILDAGLDIYSNDGHWVFSLYGRNMLDEVKHGGDTQLPPAINGVPTGGTFSPLAKGQVYGAEATYNF